MDTDLSGSLNIAEFVNGFRNLLGAALFRMEAEFGAMIPDTVFECAFDKIDQPCTCESKWSYPSGSSSCADEQSGCTNCDKDPAGSWCV